MALCSREKRDKLVATCNNFINNLFSTMSLSPSCARPHNRNGESGRTREKTAKIREKFSVLFSCTLQLRCFTFNENNKYLSIWHM